MLQTEVNPNEEHVAHIPITLFQAPLAVLSEHGLLMKCTTTIDPMPSRSPPSITCRFFTEIWSTMGHCPKIQRPAGPAFWNISSPYITAMTGQTQRPAAVCRSEMW